MTESTYSASAPPRPLSGRVATVTLNPAIDLSAGVRDFVPGAVNRVLWEQEDPGGKGINVAAFLAAFGVDVAATGFIGRENESAFRALFAAKAIDARFVPVAGRTRTNIKMIDQAKRPEQVTEVNFPGFTANAAGLEALESILDRLAEDHDWFVLSGSLPAGVPRSTYARLIERLKGKGRRVMLDTSGAALVAGLEAQPHVVKPNIDELGEIMGRRLTHATAAATIDDLHRQGIETVIVSMGPDGATFSDSRQRLRAIPPSVTIRSTVGAGDAMVAGYLIGVLRGQPLAERAKLATAFSVGVLSMLGPRLPPPSEVEARVADVHIETSKV